MSAIPVGLTSNLYGEKIRLNSAKRVASPSHVPYDDTFGIDLYCLYAGVLCF